MNHVNQTLWKLERCPCGLTVHFFNCSLASYIFSVRDDLTVAKHECHIRGLLPFAPDISVSAEGRKRGDPVIRSLPTCDVAPGDNDENCEDCGGEVIQLETHLRKLDGFALSLDVILLVLDKRRNIRVELCYNVSAIIRFHSMPHGCVYILFRFVSLKYECLEHIACHDTAVL